MIGIERKEEDSLRLKKKYAFMDLRDAKNYIIKYMWKESAKNHSLSEFREIVSVNMCSVTK